MLVLEDGLLTATVSAGKSFRREAAMQMTSDLRSGRIKVKTLAALKNVLKSRYHASVVDIQAIIDALRSRRVVEINRVGVLMVLPEAAACEMSDGICG